MGGDSDDEIKLPEVEPETPASPAAGKRKKKRRLSTPASAEGAANATAETPAEEGAALPEPSRRHEFPELRLNVGLSLDNLYLKPREPLEGELPAFDTAVETGKSQLRVMDYADGVGVPLPVPIGQVREVRGAAPRPLDDSKLRRKERKALKEERLEGWFGLPKHKLTPEIIQELKAVKLRNAMDPKRFYKSNDSDELPKYFTFATEVRGGLAPAGMQARRDPHPLSGRSLLQQMLGDSKVQDWTAKRAGEVAQREWESHHSGHGNKNGKSTRRGGAWKKTKKS